MKALYILLLVSSINISLQAQDSWQEYLSHQYYSNVSNGHLFIDGELTIANFISTEKIIGNQKAEIMLDYPGFMYQKIKTTRTGINSKELLLLEAFDYDIPGLGLTSLRNNNGTFWGKEQFGYEEFDFDFQFVPDGIISPSDDMYDQVIDHNGNLNRLINGVIEQTSPSPSHQFHEGLDDHFFMIRNDSLFSYTNTSSFFVFTLPSGFTKLDNDPYRNSLVVQVDNQYTWYNYDDFSEVYTIEIEEQINGNLQFEEFGFYALSKTEDEYKILKYSVTGTQSIETIYTLPQTDISGFSISTFEVDNQDIYFIGVIRNNLGVYYHYVQKRTIEQQFEPQRQDLAIDTFSVKQINDQEWDNYAYTITVTNNGFEEINSFAISTNTLPVFHFSFSFIREHFDIVLQPGETFSYTDTISLFSAPNQMEIFVTGVNYGLDANPNNDSYLADISSLSNSNLSKFNIRIYPNPTSNLLYIKGVDDMNSIIKIYALDGKLVHYDRLSYDLINVENLQLGTYFLSIKNDHKKTIFPFIRR